MPSIVVRILKNAIPSALFLAFLGYLMAEISGMWFDSQVPQRSPLPGVEEPLQPPTGAAIASSLRLSLPLVMAFWGFLLVTVFELILWLWRGSEEPKKLLPDRARGVLPPPEDDVEALLNQLLQQAEAAEAARKTRGSGKVSPPTPREQPTGTDSAAIAEKAPEPVEKSTSDSPEKPTESASKLVENPPDSPPSP